MEEVTRREFKRSFKKHYHCYLQMKGYDNQRRLLLFYSVECGLKCLIMNKYEKNSYSELLRCDGMEDLQRNGHDLKFLLKTATWQERFPIDVIRFEKRNAIAPAGFNQIWRYGIQGSVHRDEEKAEAVMSKIAAELDKLL